MQTNLDPDILATDRGRTADAILRACVHCGFCNATCPTYQVRGDELDGPRGRIYLMKSMLEAGRGTREMRTHLDRCLTCRNCETTCPSGVRYGELLEIGRELLDETCARPPVEAAARWLINEVVQRPALLGAAIGLGQRVRGLLPAALASKVPATVPDLPWPAPRHARRVLLLTGCAQAAATPDVNHAIATLLDGLGVSALPADGCCGALPHHLGQVDSADGMLARNVRAWQAAAGADVEAVISSASGCGVHVKDYGRLVKDARLAAGAQALAGKTVDIAEYLTRLVAERGALRPATRPRRVAWHPPCTLQHGQRVTGVVERLLEAAGHTLVPVQDAHLCCGSAGTYSVLQPELATTLGGRKLASLRANSPEVIATANIGCQLHLNALSGQDDAAVPVVHWVQLLG
jgi:glycolate oxidase iron-sulfur subunit